MSVLYDSPHQLEPYVLSDLGDLEPLTLDLIKADEFLRGKLHPLTQLAVAELVRDMNCYYSNLIEGHRTLPIDIEKAKHHDFSADKTNSDLQKLAAAHLDAETLLQSWVQEGRVPYTADFIRDAHLTFCNGLPSDMLAFQHAKGSPKAGKTHRLVPGQWRDRDVTVSAHLPPASASIPAFMGRFEETQKSRGSNMLQLANAIAGHHRLTWIHPFGDGNGRISRLVTDAQLKHLGINASGLWSWSRGLAKNQARYMQALAEADNHRAGDLDGRGNLSLRSLRNFVRVGLEIAIDQAKFMAEMLQLENFKARVTNHFVRERPDVEPAAARIIVNAVALGEIKRGEAKDSTGFSPRKAQDLIRQLLDEGYLSSDSPKGALRAAFPIKAMGAFFPNLFPSGSVETNAQTAMDYVAGVNATYAKTQRPSDLLQDGLARKLLILFIFCIS